MDDTERAQLFVGLRGLHSQSSDNSEPGQANAEGERRRKLKNQPLEKTTVVTPGPSPVDP
eukprot:14047331-Alexandrium_andersonii.AAC.1